MQQQRANQPRMDAAHYVAKRDGAPLEYLSQCRSEGHEGLFLGVEQYRALWDARALVAGETYIRIMHGVARSDEHYLVISRDEVEGIELESHSGRPGRHPAESVIPAARIMFEVRLWARWPSA